MVGALDGGRGSAAGVGNAMDRHGDQLRASCERTGQHAVRSSGSRGPPGVAGSRTRSRSTSTRAVRPASGRPGQVAEVLRARHAGKPWWAPNSDRLRRLDRDRRSAAPRPCRRLIRNGVAGRCAVERPAIRGGAGDRQNVNGRAGAENRRVEIAGPGTASICMAGDGARSAPPGPPKAEFAPSHGPWAGRPALARPNGRRSAPTTKPRAASRTCLPPLLVLRAASLRQSAASFCSPASTSRSAG